MKIRPIYNFKILPSTIAAITLYPFIFFRNKKEDVDIYLIVHECTHIYQTRQKYILGFYFLYLFEYFKNLIKYKSHWDAYYNISFEKEARANEDIWRRKEYWKLKHLEII